MLRHLDGLHARAEPHGRVGLRQTTGHAADYARAEVVGAEGFGIEFGFAGDKEEDGAFGGGFDPGPGDETLVDCTTYSISAHHFLHPSSSQTPPRSITT